MDTGKVPKYQFACENENYVEFCWNLAGQDEIGRDNDSRLPSISEGYTTDANAWETNRVSSFSNKVENKFTWKSHKKRDSCSSFASSMASRNHSNFLRQTPPVRRAAPNVYYMTLYGW